MFCMCHTCILLNFRLAMTLIGINIQIPSHVYVNASSVFYLVLYGLSMKKLSYYVRFVIQGFRL